MLTFGALLRSLDADPEDSFELFMLRKLFSDIKYQDHIFSQKLSEGRCVLIFVILTVEVMFYTDGWLLQIYKQSDILSVLGENTVFKSFLLTSSSSSFEPRLYKH